MCKIYAATLLLLLLNGCTSSQSNYKSTNATDTFNISIATDVCEPSNAKVLDKVKFYGGDSIVLYLTCDKDSSRVCSIWKYKSCDSTVKRILTTVEKAYTYDVYDSIWPKDSIDACILDAKILNWNDGKFKILVEGAYPYTTYKLDYIVTEASDSVIHLPSTWGYLGMTHDGDHIIAQSYKYYADGGTYSIIDIYDLDGNLVKQVPLNARTIIPEDLYQIYMDEQWNATDTDIEKLVNDNPYVPVQKLITIGRKKFGNKR